MAKVFRRVKPILAKRNKFNLSFESNTTTEFGRITPFLCQEVVAGDSFRVSAEMLVRMAPLFAPSFSRVNVFVRYYFISHRLLNNDFETFITGGEDGEGTITNRNGVERIAQRPYLVVGQWLQQALDPLTELLNKSSQEILVELFGRCSLFDYLGFPTYDIDEDLGWDSFFRNFAERVDLTPFMAYQMMFNEYYRDQNFQDEVDLVADCQGNIFDYLLAQNLPIRVVHLTIYNLLKIRIQNWEKDYFTSALPFPQRGEDTTIGENDVNLVNTYDQYRAEIVGNYADVDMQEIARGLNISNKIVASVNEFRRAMAIQKFKEASARFGSRFTEYLRGFFGVSPTDSRLQRPEYLGGGRVPIMFGEVLQTSETNLTPQGSYAGRGIAGGQVPSFKSRFDEPGWIIGVLSVMPKPFYAQGWPRKFSRFDRFDWYNPLFANLGEQEILQKELVFDYNPSGTPSGSDQVNNKLFGYIPRYSEMRYNPSEIHGDFRYTLMDWHTARVMKPNQDLNLSMLNADFLAVDKNSANRIFNYRGGDFDHFWIEIFNKIDAIRPLPKFGTPLI